MSRPIQFQRPVEFDPALAAAAHHSASANASSPPVNRRAQLKDDLGFDSDVELSVSASEEDESAELGDDPRAAAASPSKRKAASEAELDRVMNTVRLAQDAKSKAEAAQKAAEDRLEEFQRLGEQAKKILVNKFKEQIRGLQEQIEEMKSQIEENEETIDQLRKNGGVSGVVDSVDSDRMVEIRKENRELKIANKELKIQIEEWKEKAEKAAAQAQTQAAAPVSVSVSVPVPANVSAASEREQALDVELSNLRRSLATAEADAQQSRRQADEARSALSRAEAQTAELSERIAKLLKDNEAEKQSAAAREQINKGESESELKELKQTIKQTQSAAEEWQKAVGAAGPIILDAQEIQQALERWRGAAVAPERASQAAMQSELAQLQSDNESLKRSIAELGEIMKSKDAEMEGVKEKAKEKLTTASDAIKKLKSEYATLKTQYLTIKANNQEIKAGRDKYIDGLQKALTMASQWKIWRDQVKTQIERATLDFSSAMEPVIAKECKSLLAKRAGDLDSVMNLYKKEMTLRKQYFNQIQELKGNIRVYARVRPLSSRELDEKSNCIEFSAEDENKLVITNPEKRTVNSFEFEKIFKPDSTQDQVFQEVSDLVLSVLDGYNTSIFAYGQTGTGKTWTMEGPPENPGVNRRTMAKLFSSVQERSDDTEYKISISLLEIYNEKIQDLLNPQGKQALKIVTGASGMEVPDLTTVPVTSSDEVLDTLKLGQKNRKVVATAMNDQSSRSHLVLSVYVRGRNKLSNKETFSRLNLIDLAGSERVSRSGVTGDAMKEAQAINSSLSALGNVIHARANKAAHVPYRDSVLTWLLKDSLEKNSKTLMIVQVSPNASDAGESICSLRFAERVRQVELGAATVNRKDSAAKQDKK